MAQEAVRQDMIEAARSSLPSIWPNDAKRDPASYRVLIDSLYASPDAFILSNIVGSLVPVFCWYASDGGPFGVLTLATISLAVLRLSVMARFRAVRHPAMGPADLLRWDRLYCFTATTFSFLLGCVAFVALAWTESVPCHLLTVGSALAFAAAYVSRNAGRPVFVILQVACFCVPTSLGLAVADEPYYGFLSAFIALAGLGNVSIVFALNANLLQLAAATKRSALLADSLQHQNLTLDTALNSMTHGLCMLSPDLKLELCNDRFLELYGMRGDDLRPGIDLRAIMGRLVHAQVLAPQSATDLQDLCARAAALAQGGEREILTEQGHVFVISVDLTADGGILLLTEDATARKAAAAQIERMAHCDTLTGLPNRFRFSEVLKTTLARAPLERGTVALLYIDLDDFKIVNDTMGHEAGDHLLVQVGQRLQHEVQTLGLVGRFGGDEFLLLVHVADDEAALAFGRRVISAIAEPIEIEGKSLSVTTSVGIALGPQHGSEPSELLRSADMALYAAKADGRNKAVLYTREIAIALSHRREMETDLREATRSGRLFLLYQPIVDARTAHVRSFEALMRWSHPVKGVISPAEFIPIAEQTGLIVQMGAWALRQACMDAKTWPEHVTVAVNVSAFQFKDTRQLIEAVKDALLISGLNPIRLELEVTESLLIADQDATLDAIRVLRRLGVRFSLDDFGSGYSSLGYLARYPFSKVKIDRSFAEHITSDGPSRSIIEVVCQLAQKLGMRVVVEGIETESQRREIVALGAEQAQGYLFGRPQALESLDILRQDAA